MKSLKDYINEQLQNTPSYYKRLGVIIDECDPYDYDKFIINNNFKATNESYRKFVNYTDTILGTLPFDMQTMYSDYQSALYERLKDSLDYNELIKKLQDLFGFGNVIDVVNSKSNIAKNFTIQTNNIDIQENSIKENPEFISLLSYYNYFINAVGENYIQLAPYKPTEATDKIYNDFNGILYHICTKDQLARIKKYGLVPRNVKSEKINRPYRRFYIQSGNKKENISELKILANGLIKGVNRRNEQKSYKVYKEDIVFLKIDVTKSTRKYKFFNDDSASGYHAYFTEETIPPYCIEVVGEFDDLKNL